MKQFLLTFIATLMAVTAFAQSQTVPYSSTMTTKDWTVVDANNDGKTWEATTSSTDWSGSGYTTGMKYSYSGSNPGNDWLISPAIHLEAGKKYLISHQGRRYNTNSEKYTIYVGLDSDPDQLKGAHKIRDFDDSNLTSSFNKFEDLVEVSETGDYYIGFHCTSPANKWYAYVTGFTIDEYRELPGAISNLTVTSGEQGAMKANLSWNWPATNSLNGALESQLTGAKIYRTDSSLVSSPSTTNLVKTITLDTPAAPGSSYSCTDDTFAPDASNKTYYYWVVPFTEGGDSPIAPTKASSWIGPDELASVTNVTATASPDNINHIKINFVSAGKQGGYIDHSTLTYKITRRVGSGAETTVIDNLKYDQLPYTDTNVPGFNAYTYKVYVNQLSGDRGIDSNKVIGGGTVDLPYSNTFDNAASLDLFSLGHTESSNVDWSWYSMYSCLQFAPKTTTSDAWAITPPVSLNANGSYKLTFTPYVTSTTYSPDDLKVYIVNSTNPSDWNEPIFAEAITVARGSAQPISKEFIAPENGVYYIVFRGKGSSSSSHALCVDDLLFERFDRAPLAVENLTATAGEQGAMSTTLTWTNPTGDNKQGTLDTIDKLVVIRNGEEIHEITSGIEVGGEVTYQDVLTGKEPGNYSYTVVAYLEDVPGAKAEPVSIWLGEDTGVNAPTNLSIEIDPEHLVEGTVLLHFDAPTGKNGGYVDPAKIAYNIYRKDGTSVTATTLFNSANKIAENYTGAIPYSDTPATFNKYTYGVRVVYNGTEVTDNTMFDPILAGPTPTIPYSEPFDASTLPATYTFFKNSGINNWGASTANGGYAYVSTGSGKALDAWLVTPGIYMEGGKTYVVKFDSYGSITNNSAATPNKYGDLHLYVGKGTTQEAFDQEFGNIIVTNKTSEPKEARFYIAESGIYNVAFRDYASDFSYAYSQVCIDNLNIVELPVAPKEPTAATATVGTGGALSVVLNWTNPTEANDGTSLNSIEKVEIYREGTEDAIATLTNQNPGEGGTYTDSAVPAAGVYTYYIKPYLNGNTYDYATVVTDWIGPDQLAPVKDVVAKMSTENSNHIEINFVSEGANGGYINHEEVSYTITRRVGTGSSGEPTTVADNVKYDELPYVDTTVPGLDQYTYKVTVNELSSDKGVDSNTVIGGGTVELPYTNDFETAPTINLFTRGHAGTGSRDWEQNQYTLAFWTTNTTDTHDAWAITPPVAMLEGSCYKITFSPFVSVTSHSKTLKAYVVNSLDPSDWDEPEYEEFVNWTTRTPKSIEFTAPSSGVYYVAFRFEGTYSSTYQYLRVDDLLIERFDRAPLAVENLEATAGAEGAMTATLTWTNPTMTNKNDNLETIDKIVILRDNEEVGTITSGIEVGAEGTYTDDIAGGEAGNYNYNVVAYLDDVPGAKSETVTVWVGQDELKAPENVAATLNMDGYPQITFDAVSTGLHGGYIDAESVRYRVYRGSTKIADNLSEPKYTDESEELESGTTYSYSVSSYIGETESAKSAAVSIKYIKVDDLTVVYELKTRTVAETWDLTKGWKYSSSYGLENTSTVDRWTYSTPFRVQAGTVQVTARLAAESNTRPQIVKFYLTKDPSDNENLINTIDNYFVENLTSQDFDNYEFNFEVSEDGVYYLKVYSNCPTTYTYYTRMEKVTIEQSSIADPNNLPQPQNVAFVIQEDGSRLVSFDAVTENMGGEPVVPTYTIYRDGVQIAEGVETNSYVDDAEVDLGKHYYGVQAVNGEYASKIVNTESQVFGGALSLPYTPDFTNAEVFDLWNLGADWKYGSPYNHANSLYTSKENAMMFSPPFKAEKGKVTLKFIPNAYSGLYKAKMAIYLVTDTETVNEEDKIWEEEISYSSMPTAKEQEISIPKAGVYYLAFKNTMDEDAYLWQAEIIQTETILPVAPEAVAGLTAEVGAQGAMEVTLSWTNPTLTVAEEDIEAISAIVISEDDTVVATLQESEYLGLGETVEYTLTGIETAGVHTYTVTVTAEELNSEPAEVTTGWVGIDTPKPVENATAVLSADGKTVTVTWDAVGEEGANGGYVDADAITYEVTRMPGNVTVATESEETSAEDNVAELGYGRYYYQISLTGYDKVEAATTDKVTVGDALDLPYSQAFNTSDDFELWTSEGWAFGSPHNNPDSYYSETAGDVAFTPPFRAQTGRVKLTYTPNSFSGIYGANVEIYLTSTPSIDGCTPVATETVSYSNEPSAKELPIGIENDGIYYLAFKNTTDNTMGLYLWTADIEQADVYAEAAPKAPASVEAAIEEDGSVTVTFQAVSQDINDYELEGVKYDVYRNGEKLTGTPQTELTYSDDTEGLEFAKYVYSVKAVWGEFASEATEASALIFGEALSMDYSKEFAEDNELWSVIAPEGSGATWTYFDDGENDPYFYTTSAEAMLVTPPLRLENVKAALSISAAAGHETETEKLNLHVVMGEATADTKINEFELEGTEAKTISHEFEILEAGEGRIGFTAVPAEGSTGVRLYVFNLSNTGITTGVKTFSTSVLVYDKATQTIRIPAEGTLEVFTAGGMRVVMTRTNEDVNISGLGAGTYAARFVDLNGNVSIVKFVK